MEENEIKCERKDECISYPKLCAKCKWNQARKKKDYFEPDNIFPFILNPQFQPKTLIEKPFSFWDAFKKKEEGRSV